MQQPIIFNLNRDVRCFGKKGVLPLMTSKHPLSIGRGGGAIAWTQDLTTAATAPMAATVAKTDQKPLTGAMATMAGVVAKIAKKILSAS